MPSRLSPDALHVSRTNQSERAGARCCSGESHLPLPWPYYGCQSLFLLAQFLESGIGAQRIPDWVEPEKAGRDRRQPGNPAIIGGL